MSQQNKLGYHATAITTKNGMTGVIFHSTMIVKFNNEQIILNSGGWFRRTKSSTTKTRMNQASSQFDLGFKVWQKNFKWFVDYNGKTLEFTDSMTLSR